MSGLSSRFRVDDTTLEFLLYGYYIETFRGVSFHIPQEHRAGEMPYLPLMVVVDPAGAGAVNVFENAADGLFNGRRLVAPMPSLHAAVKNAPQRPRV